MLALYICVGTGILVWLWLVWDLTREMRAKRAQPVVSEGPADPAPESKPSAKAKAQIKAKPKPKPGQRRPRQKVSYTRHRRKPPPEPASEPEPDPQPPKPARDPREWMDEDYD